MYIKIKDTCANSQRLIRISDFSYEKVQIKSEADYRKFRDEWGDIQHTEFFGRTWRNKEGWNVGTVIALIVTTDDKAKVICTLQCDIYVMGDDGKTVDVIRD